MELDPWSCLCSLQMEKILHLKQNINSTKISGSCFCISNLRHARDVFMACILSSIQGIARSSCMYYMFQYIIWNHLQVLIVLFVIIVGAFKVDVSNWSPFAPNGAKSILTGATVVFFAYVGFDAVANSAEESKRPQVC